MSPDLVQLLHAHHAGRRFACAQHDSACAGPQRAYWRRQLAGAPALLKLPTDHARPPVHSGAGGTVPFALPAALTQRLRYLAAGANATMFMVMVAAWQARRPCTSVHTHLLCRRCLTAAWGMLS